MSVYASLWRGMREEGDVMAEADSTQDRMMQPREKLFSALLTGSIKHLVDVATEELGNHIMVAD